MLYLVVFEAKFSDPALDIFALTKKLDENATYHGFITGTTAHPDNEMQAALEQLRELKVTVTYPLILRLLTIHASGKLTNQETAQAVRMVSGFVFRRYICGASSRAYGNWFVAACAAVQNAPVGELQAFLQSKGCPSDIAFEQSLENFNLYSSGLL